MNDKNQPQQKQGSQQKPKDNFRGKTNVPGQNPKQNDDPSHDEHHDENRQP